MGQIPILGLDIETCGFAKEQRRIVSIALSARFSAHYWVCRPPVPIAPRAAQVHGIRDDDVTDAPTFPQVAPTVAAFLGAHLVNGARLVTWNGERFDLPILLRELELAEIPWPALSLSHIDLLPVAKRQLSSLPNQQMGTVCEHFAVPLRSGTNAVHRADEDAAAVRALGERFAARGWVSTRAHVPGAGQRDPGSLHPASCYAADAAYDVKTKPT